MAFSGPKTSNGHWKRSCIFILGSSVLSWRTPSNPCRSKICDGTDPVSFSFSWWFFGTPFVHALPRSTGFCQIGPKPSRARQVTNPKPFYGRDELPRVSQPDQARPHGPFFADLMGL